MGLKTVIHRDGELVLDDYLICNPKLDDMHGLGYFEGYQAYGSVVIIDDCIDKTVIDGMRDYLEAHHIDCLYGVTKLENVGLLSVFWAPIIMLCGQLFLVVLIILEKKLRVMIR